MGGAQGLLADTLNKVGYLGHILSCLVAIHIFYILSTCATRDVICRSLRQHICLLSIHNNRRRKTHVRSFSHLPARGKCQYTTPSCLETQSNKPLSLVAFSEFGLILNSSSRIQTPFFLKTDVTFPWSIYYVWKKDREKKISNENV